MTWGGNTPLGEVLAAFGRVPLPPYIKRAADKKDLQTYQTAHAANDGYIRRSSVLRLVLVLNWALLRHARYSPRLSVQCPVLTWAMLLPEASRPLRRASISGTAAAIGLGARYAMPARSVCDSRQREAHGPGQGRWHRGTLRVFGVVFVFFFFLFSFLLFSLLFWGWDGNESEVRRYWWEWHSNGAVGTRKRSEDRQFGGESETVTETKTMTRTLT
eukprot:1223914-Rhodomonas_salina.1